MSSIVNSHSQARNSKKARSLGIALAVALAFSLCPIAAFATPTSAEKRAEAQEVLKKLNEMQQRLDETSNNYFIALEAETTARNAKEAKQAELNETTAKLAVNQDKLADSLRTMYRNGTTTYLDVFLGASSFEELATSLDCCRQINDKFSEQVQETKDLRARVEQQKAECEEQERIATEKAEVARQIKEESEQTVAQMQATYDNLNAEAAELLEQERKAQEEAEAARAAAVLEANRASAAQYSSGSYTEPSYNPVTGNVVVDRAYSYVGKAEYVWGGCSPGAFDCSGFVAYCLTGRYARLGTTHTFLGWPQVSNPQPGDIAVNSGHCGIYIGNGQMIHCATYGVGVIIGPVQGGMTFHRY